jgi:hypothetical protein
MTIVGRQAAMESPGRKIRVGNLDMNVVIAGEGPDVLLFQVRGAAEFLATRSDWRLFRLLTRYPEQMPEWRQALSRRPI